MTTLAKIQLFFSSTEEEYDGKASQDKFNESVRSFVSDQVKGFRSGKQLWCELHWQIQYSYECFALCNDRLGPCHP